jgi:PleD family two-component response regulator
MPEMNGFECLRSLKEHNDFKNTAVVILSAISAYGAQDLANSLGASFFLYKLFDFFLFKKNISNILNLNFLRALSSQKEFIK